MTKTPLWKTRANAARRELILQAALDVFGTRGFATPTMDDVAAAAGYSRRNLYRFFPSKAALGAALGVYCCRMFDPDPTTAGTLEQLVEQYWQFSCDYPREFRVFLDIREWLSTTEDAELAAALQTEQHAFWQHFIATASPGAGEVLAVAVGYVEFLFRYRALWESTGLAGDAATVRAMLRRICQIELSGAL